MISARLQSWLADSACGSYRIVFCASYRPVRAHAVVRGPSRFGLGAIHGQQARGDVSKNRRHK